MGPGYERVRRAIVESNQDEAELLHSVSWPRWYAVQNDLTTDDEYLKSQEIVIAEDPLLMWQSVFRWQTLQPIFCERRYLGDTWAFCKDHPVSQDVLDVLRHTFLCGHQAPDFWPVVVFSAELFSNPPYGWSTQSSESSFNIGPWMS